MKHFAFIAVIAAFMTSSLFAVSYPISPSNSSVGFTITHFRFDKVEGKFSEFSGQLDWDPFTKSVLSLKGTIDARTIDTDNRSRDGHLRSSEFFDVKTFPLILFSSTKVVARKGGFDVTGTFTMHGVTKSILIPLDLLAYDGLTRAPRFNSKISIKRSDFGISESPRLISDDVDIFLKGVMEAPKDIKGEKK